MGVYSTTATGAQDGHAIGGIWTEGGATLILSTSHNIGIQFFLGIEFDAEGRPLDPPLVYPSLDLTLHIAQVLAAGTVDISLVEEAAPDPYSNTLLPGARDEVALETVDVGLADTTLEVTLDMTDMIEYFRSSDWNGIISLTLETTDIGILNALTFHSAEGATAAYAPSIVTTETPFSTGFLNGPALGRRARLRHCPRTGMPVASDQMVRDGYKEGLMVSPEGWEPEDPEDRYVPSPLEGVVDDEV